MAKRIKGVYSIVNRLHEPIPPIGSDDYALTGNVTAGSFGLFIRTLMGDAAAASGSGFALLAVVYRLTRHSVFMGGYAVDRLCILL